MRGRRYNSLRTSPRKRGPSSWLWMPAFAGMSGLVNVPLHRQILQSTERPAGDPHRLAVIEPQALEPREHGRQRDVGDHRARSRGAGAEMRPRAERDAFARVARHVEFIRL